MFSLLNDAKFVELAEILILGSSLIYIVSMGHFMLKFQNLDGMIYTLK